MKKWYLFYSGKENFSELAHRMEESLDMKGLKLQQVGMEIDEKQKLHQLGADMEFPSVFGFVSLPAAIPGLFVGCFLSNLFCGAAGLDIVFGSLATLIGAVGSYALRKSKVLVCVPPILANTIIVPWVLRFAYGSEDLIPFMMLTVGIGEVLAIGVLGSILLAALNRYKTMLFGKCLATGR